MRYKVKQDVLSGLHAVIDSNNGSVLDLYQSIAYAKQACKKLNVLIDLENMND